MSSIVNSFYDNLRLTVLNVVKYVHACKICYIKFGFDRFKIFMHVKFVTLNLDLIDLKSSSVFGAQSRAIFPYGESLFRYYSGEMRNNSKNA